MDSVLGVVIVLAVLAAYGFLLGHSFCTLFGKKETAGFRILLGMMLFFAIFSVVELPIEKANLPFHVLVYAETGVFAALLAACLLFCGKKGEFRKLREWKTPDMWTTVFLFLILLQVIYGMNNGGRINGYDTSYYNGHAMNAIYTDTMYQYNPKTGIYVGMETYYHDCYPMLIAYLAKLFLMHPLVVVNRVLAMIEIVLINLIVYETVRRISRGNIRVATWTAGIYAAMSVWCYQAEEGRFFHLWQRTAESKSMLANVYLPFALLAVILLAMEGGKLYCWLILAAAVIAGTALSGSGIFLLPVMAGSGLLAVILCQRRWNYLPYSAACMLPGIVIGVIRIFL